MRKYKLLIIALTLCTVCMLCGCGPSPHIDIECNGLEEGDRVFVLVRPAEGEKLHEPEESDLIGSEVYTADKDGFVLAEQMYNPYTEQFVTEPEPECSLVFGAKSDRLIFCEKHKVIRLAVCDDKWHIKKISGDIEVCCSDKHAVVTAGKYDISTDSFERTDIVRRTYWGWDNMVIYIILILGSWFTNAVLFISMLVLIKKRRPVKTMTLNMWFGSMSVFNVLVTMFLLAEKLVPYLNIKDAPFILSDIGAVILINALWVIDLWLLIIYRSRKKRGLYDIKSESRERTPR